MIGRVVRRDRDRPGLAQLKNYDFFLATYIGFPTRAIWGVGQNGPIPETKIILCSMWNKRGLSWRGWRVFGFPMRRNITQSERRCIIKVRVILSSFFRPSWRTGPEKEKANPNAKIAENACERVPASLGRRPNWGMSPKRIRLAR